LEVVLGHLGAILERLKVVGGTFKKVLGGIYRGLVCYLIPKKPLKELKKNKKGRKTKGKKEGQ
jgi:hypothetical protein